MKVTVVSHDCFFVDTLVVALTVFGVEKVDVCSKLGNSAEDMFRGGEPDDILIFDAQIPAMDYFTLADFLRKNFNGKFIALTSANGITIQHSQLAQAGFHAVVDKSGGLIELWGAMVALIEGENFFAKRRTPLKNRLNNSQYELAMNLLVEGEDEIAKSKNITRQGVNKNKAKIYEYLHLSSVAPDCGFRLFWRLNNRK